MARTGPANPARLSGAFGAQNYGIRLAPVISVSHGIAQRSQEAHSRQRQVMYAKQVQEPPFIIGMAFSNVEEYRDMFEWFRAYGYLITNTDSNIGPMRVLVPSRNFDKIGIPTAGMTFGDAVEVLTYHLSVTFEGTTDPITTDTGALTPYWSQFVLPGKDAAQIAPNFYPGGVQLSGSFADEDSLYAPTAPPLLNSWPIGNFVSDPGSGGGNGGRRLK